MSQSEYISLNKIYISEISEYIFQIIFLNSTRKIDRRYFLIHNGYTEISFINRNVNAERTEHDTEHIKNINKNKKYIQE